VIVSCSAGAGIARPAMRRSARMTLPNRSVASSPPRIWLNSWFTAARSPLGIADLRCKCLVGDGGLALGCVDGKGPTGGVRRGNIFPPWDGGLEDAAAELLAESL